MEERRDAYEVLGVSRTASADEVRKAYRQAALKHHPDRNAGDVAAAERFKEATEAFQVLSDEQRRRAYDQFGWAGIEGGGGGFPGGVDLGDLFGNFQDLFSEFFGGGGRSRSRGPRRGPDVRVLERLTLKEAAFGCKREIALQFPAPCDSCSGSGAAPGTAPVACGTCRGTGQVSNARGFVMFTAPCPTCRGEGRVIKTPCPACHGSGEQAKSKKIVVSFPPGIDEGQILRVSGQGVPSPDGGPTGDVLVQVEVEPDERFERHGVDLATKVKVSFLDAAFGAHVDVPALDDEPLAIEIPEGTQPGHVAVVRGRGVPRLDGKGRARGALHVVIDVEIPSASSMPPKARELLQALRSELAPDRAPEPRVGAAGRAGR